MKPFYDLNRLICRCLEVLNILIALPFAAFIYAVSVDYLTRTIPASTFSPSFYSSKVTINIISVVLALVAVLYINGGIAQALDKRRFLEHISQSVEDLDREKDQVTILHAHDIVTSDSVATKPALKKKSVKNKSLKQPKAKKGGIPKKLGILTSSLSNLTTPL